MLCSKDLDTTKISRSIEMFKDKLHKMNIEGTYVQKIKRSL